MPIGSRRSGRSVLGRRRLREEADPGGYGVIHAPGGVGIPPVSGGTKGNASNQAGWRAWTDRARDSKAQTIHLSHDNIGHDRIGGALRAPGEYVTTPMHFIPPLERGWDIAAKAPRRAGMPGKIAPGCVSDYH